MNMLKTGFLLALLTALLVGLGSLVGGGGFGEAPCGEPPVPLAQGQRSHRPPLHRQSTLRWRPRDALFDPSASGGAGAPATPDALVISQWSEDGGA